LLGDRRWDEHYPLTLAMTMKSTEYEDCCGRFEPCERQVDEVILKGRTIEDKIEVSFRRVGLLVHGRSLLAWCHLLCSSPTRCNEVLASSTSPVAPAQKYVKMGLINCHYMLMLLLAEDAAATYLNAKGVDKKKKSDPVRDKVREDNAKEILAMYEKAISVATRSGFSQGAALANERAGIFVTQSGCENLVWWAGIYLENARDMYAEWGADAKVQQLNECYGDVMTGADDTLDVRTSSHIKGK
jgi:hypothetical protein